MAQFSVHRNLNPSSRATVPLLLDVQADLLSELGTRVVIPLFTAASMKGKGLETLTPEIRIDGKYYVLMTPQLAGISRKELGPEVATLAGRRQEIIAALDMLIAGI